MGINISKIILLRDRAHSHNICDSIILLVIVKLLVCLIQILNFRIDMYVCIGKNVVFLGLGTVHGLRHPLGGLRRYPLWIKGLLCFVISSSVRQSVFHLVLFSSIFFTQGTTLTTGWVQYWEKGSLFKNVFPCHLPACLKLLKMPRNVKSTLVQLLST